MENNLNKKDSVMKNLVTCECGEIFEDNNDFCEAECPRCFATIDTTFDDEEPACE